MISDHLLLLLDGLTVLRTEEREQMLTGRQPGKAGGLGSYLAAHAAGVVQLEDPQPISSDGQMDVFWVPVGCLAATEATALALARDVALRLCGTQRDPGAYTRQIPDHPRRLNDAGAWLCRPTFSIALLAGFEPG